MTERVVKVAPTLDERGFETLVSSAVLATTAPAAGEPETLLFDAREVVWADPYGMIGLLAVGREISRDAGPSTLWLPESANVLSYLVRMGFMELAAEVFELRGSAPPRRGGGSSNVLLEITPVVSHEDVHGVIEHVQERAGTILTEGLKYSRGDGAMFSMILSEVCQNIIEHADAGGWVGIQTYNWAQRLGRLVVEIAVMDLGVGFRGSLAQEHAASYGEQWDDAMALEAAFLHGTTRFRDPGRGQGLKQIRNHVNRWGGKVAIRSGSARIAEAPPWAQSVPLERDLAPFPGSQILIVLPARE